MDEAKKEQQSGTERLRENAAGIIKMLEKKYKQQRVLDLIEQRTAIEPAKVLGWLNGTQEIDSREAAEIERHLAKINHEGIPQAQPSGPEPQPAISKAVFRDEPASQPLPPLSPDQPKRRLSKKELIDAVESLRDRDQIE